jgi:hypothetical protein
MQLMQTDPKAAMTKFSGDAEVTAFLKAFGEVMAAHFDKLGAAQAAATGQSQPQNVQSTLNFFFFINSTAYFVYQAPAPAAAPVIQEVGPLQAKALQKQKEKEAKLVSSDKKTTTAVGSSSDVENEEERVQRVRYLLLIFNK